MKPNFDVEAARQLAADIQSASRPKSITPDMVGGLLAALVEAVASLDCGGNITGGDGSSVDLSSYATLDALTKGLAGKVDKIDGKQLSVEDFTTALKSKLEGLSNYDDTNLSKAVSALRRDLDTLLSGDTTTAIESFNEIIAFLKGVDDSENLDGIIASIQQQIASKQDAIELKTINGQSILGKGNIVIECGGDSGNSSSGTQTRDEYAPLKYLENTGTQYIDTGIVLTKDDIITVDFEIPDAAAAVNTDKILIDARDSSNGVRVSTYSDNKKWYARFGNSSGLTSAVQSAAIRQGSLIFSKESLIVNGVTVLSNFTFTAMPTGTLKLFSGVTPDGAISAPSYARISSVKITRGGENIMNLVPVQRIVDGVLGMRDLISEAFLINAGTGTFGYELAPIAADPTVKKYPSLTDTQKAAIQALMDDYYNNKSTFYYEFTHNRDAFATSGCYTAAKSKFKMCCATFVQNIMMGRSVNDYVGKTAKTYSSKITRTSVSDFGYYFDFKLRKYLYGIQKKDEDGNVVGYYDFVQPNADNYKGSYSLNSYYMEGANNLFSQNFNGFCNANDMARELYEMGCEVPFSELEVGDIIFTCDNDLSNDSSMFNFSAWRNIYHVAMVYDVKQIDASSKAIYYIECTSYFDVDNRPIEKPAITSEQMDLRFKGFKLSEDCVFCARFPIAFGYEANVPATITTTAKP